MECGRRLNQIIPHWYNKHLKPSTPGRTAHNFEACRTSSLSHYILGLKQYVKPTSNKMQPCMLLRKFVQSIVFKSYKAILGVHASFDIKLSWKDSVNYFPTPTSWLFGVVVAGSFVVDSGELINKILEGGTAFSWSTSTTLGVTRSVF